MFTQGLSVIQTCLSLICGANRLSGGSNFAKAQRFKCLQMQHGRPRLVCASGVFTQPVPCQCVCPRPRSTAQIPILADPTLASEPVRVPQSDEQWRGSVRLAQVLPPDIAGRNRQETAGENFAGVGDKNEALAVVDAGDAADEAPAVAGRTRAFRFAPLGHVPAVVLRLSCFDIEGRGLR